MFYGVLLTDSRRWCGCAVQGLVNPITGLPEQRLLFEYLPLWRQLLQPEDPETLAALRQPSFAGMRDLQGAIGALPDADDDSDDDLGLGDDDVDMLLGLDDGEEERKGRPAPNSDDDDDDDAEGDDADTDDDGGAIVDPVQRAIDRVCQLAYDQFVAGMVQMMERLDLGVVQSRPDGGAGASDADAAAVAAGTQLGVPRRPVCVH